MSDAFPDRRTAAADPGDNGSPRLSAVRRLMAAGCGLLLALFTLHPALAGDGERPAIPDISYPDLDGTPQNLQQWQGRVLLLNFWASWCAPCQAEIRHLIDFQRQYGAQGLQVVGVGVDDARKLRNVQRSLEIDYPILAVDEKASRDVLRSWGNKNGLIPYTVIFDRSGRVVQAHRGVLDERRFDELVRPLLAPPAE